MSKHKNLVVGRDAKTPPPAETEERVAVLRATVEKYLPDFIRACDSPVEIVLMHQDAFASAYHDDEYMLLGMAIKYAGLRGKVLQFSGVNGETC